MVKECKSSDLGNSTSVIHSVIQTVPTICLKIWLVVQWSENMRTILLFLNSCCDFFSCNAIVSQKLSYYPFLHINNSLLYYLSTIRKFLGRLTYRHTNALIDFFLLWSPRSLGIGWGWGAVNGGVMFKTYNKKKRKI